MTSVPFNTKYFSYSIIVEHSPTFFEKFPCTINLIFRANLWITKITQFFKPIILFATFISLVINFILHIHNVINIINYHKLNYTQNSIFGSLYPLTMNDEIRKMWLNEIIKHYYSSSLWLYYAITWLPFEKLVCIQLKTRIF